MESKEMSSALAELKSKPSIKEKNNSLEAIPNQRTIKSYVIRSRTSKSQKKALLTLSQQFGIHLDPKLIEHQAPHLWFDSASQIETAIALEIGFGMGENLITNAQKHPKINWIGVETHDAGVGRVFNQAEKLQLKNLKVFHGDIENLLQNLTDQSLAWVQIFFPDPWPKKKHHKRRLIDEPFILNLASKMKEESKLEIATDWENYAEQIKTVFENEKIKSLFRYSTHHSFAKRSPHRILTNFEKKAEKAGRKVFDFCFVKHSSR